MSGRRYSDEEDDIIKNSHPDYSYMLRLLPHRTRMALKKRAHYLGIATRRTFISSRDSKRIREMRGWGANWKEIEAAFPKYQIESMKKHAQVQKMPLKRRYVRASHPGIEAVRQRAVELRMSFAELARRTNSGEYFKGQIEDSRVKHLAAAAALLGGELHIVWDDKLVDA